MNFDKNYVLNELRNGRDYESIMDEISKVLTEASVDFENEKKKEESRKQRQIDDMNNIMDMIYDYCIDYYGTSNEKIDQIDRLFKEEKAEDWIKIMDDLASVISVIDSFQSLNGAEEILTKFLKH